MMTIRRIDTSKYARRCHPSRDRSISSALRLGDLKGRLAGSDKTLEWVLTSTIAGFWCR